MVGMDEYSAMLLSAIVDPTFNGSFSIHNHYHTHIAPYLSFHLHLPSFFPSFPPSFSNLAYPFVLSVPQLNPKELPLSVFHFFFLAFTKGLIFPDAFIPIARPKGGHAHPVHPRSSPSHAAICSLFPLLSLSPPLSNPFASPPWPESLSSIFAFPIPPMPCALWDVFVSVILAPPLLSYFLPLLNHFLAFAYLFQGPRELWSP
ncbi:hypothetical protein BKA57DRAFT_39421 [Linnemannia elongata]|nr:hypothetical protein BKA57DRAFT_39421 [Linnemannia elongata]